MKPCKTLPGRACAWIYRWLAHCVAPCLAPTWLLRYAAALAAIWIIGRIWRDTIHLTALCFYVPSPLIALGLLALGRIAYGHAPRPRRRVAIGLPLLLALAPLVSTLLIENQWWRPDHDIRPHPRPTAPPRQAAPPQVTFRPQPPKNFRLVFWNVWKMRFGMRNCLRQLAHANADFIILAENRESPPERMFHELAPGAMAPPDPRPIWAAREKYDWTSPRNQKIVLLSHHSLGIRRNPTYRFWDLDREYQPATDGVDIQLHTLPLRAGRGGAGPLRVMVVDLPSSILVPRDSNLRMVLRTIRGHKPDIVVGDFNAPRDSNALRELPPGYAHAYDLVGEGWGYTWPVPAPLWAIDQCIINTDRVIPLSLELRSTTVSDHRMIILDFAYPR